MVSQSVISIFLYLKSANGVCKTQGEDTWKFSCHQWYKSGC